mgnify:CR=1 FL=1
MHMANSYSHANQAILVSEDFHCANMTHHRAINYMVANEVSENRVLLRYAGEAVEEDATMVIAVIDQCC